MTWIVGIIGLMTGGVLMGDVQITAEPQGEAPYPIRDFCAQKVHFIAPWMLVGYAGNVALGLAGVEDLRRALPELPPEREYDPTGIAEQWSSRLADAWTRGSPPFHQRQGPIEFMFLGADPPRQGFLPGLSEDVRGWTLRYPDFGCRQLPLRRAKSIGNGATVQPWVQALEELTVGDEERFRINEASFKVFRSETHLPQGAAARIFALTLTRAMEKHPHPEAGVGNLFHLGWLRHGSASIDTNEVESLDPALPSRRMPPVVSSLAELEQAAARGGVDASGLIS